jgi:hypothetical protein
MEFLVTIVAFCMATGLSGAPASSAWVPLTGPNSELTSVVSSTGMMGPDDFDQRIRIEGGNIIAYGTTTALNEGAEVRFVGWEK